MTATQPLSKTGIHRATLAKLQALGIHSLFDLLHYYPRDHIRYKQVRISEARVGETVTIVGKIKRHNIFTAKHGKLTVQSWTIANKSGSATITCTHFHHHKRYQAQQWRIPQSGTLTRTQQDSFYHPDRIVMLSGKIKQDSYTGGKAIEAADVRVIDLAVIPFTANDDVIQPVYALTKGVTGDVIQDCLRLVLSKTQIVDPLPAKLRSRYRLVGLQEAIAHIHFPPNQPSLEVARHRLVFDECFYLQLRLLQRRHALRQIQRDALSTQGALLEQFYQILPFPLTNAQQRVIAEILHDLARPTPMNRLVQGDVGSGKTVVAVAAILAAIQSGCQAAFMAPTEVLAEQHYRNIAEWFKPLRLPVALPTGSTPTNQRQAVHEKLRSGQLPPLIGTHALIQASVTFHQLGLVIIDEQHRFGVQQRSKLQQKGHHPHMLSLTATPIPRTLALTLHGDLDVSQLDDLPPGRQAIQTQVFAEEQRTKAHDVIWEQVMQGTSGLHHPAAGGRIRNDGFEVSRK